MAKKKMIQAVLKVDIPATLFRLEVGDQVILPFGLVSSNALRIKISRENAKNTKYFECTERYRTDGFLITRVR